MFKMGNQVSTENEEWSRTFEQIKNGHDLAYNIIESAIRFEEQEKPMEVSSSYTIYGIIAITGLYKFFS